MQGNTATQLPQILKNGYGKISEYAVTDLELIFGSRVLYALFCACMDSVTRQVGLNAETIMKYLGITKNTFYTYLKPLVEQGYVTRKYVKFGRVIYVIEDKPAKYFEESSNPKLTKKYEYIRNNGLFSSKKHYGIISRSFMCEPSHSLTSKLNYAILCSKACKTTRIGDKDFTGVGRVVKLAAKYIQRYMNVCRTTYYKHYPELCETNHITPFKTFIDGRFSENIFLINDNPDRGQAVKPSEAEIIRLCNSDKKTTKKPLKPLESATKTEHIKIVSPGNIATIEQIRRDLFENHQIPYFYNSNRHIAESAVRCLASSGNENITVVLFREALTDLICAQDTVKIRGTCVTYANIIERLTPFLDFYDGGRFLPASVNIDELCTAVCEDYERFAENQIHEGNPIRSPLRAMQTCLWTILNNGKAALTARLQQF